MRVVPPFSCLEPRPRAPAAEVYTERHVQAKGLSLASTIGYRLKPLIGHFGDRRLADIKTADVENFITELKELSRETLDAFAAVNLHWRDLRHEYASRLVERGVPLAQVRDLLGHASISTTERYDNQTMTALQAAARRLESGKTFETPAPAGRAEFQESLKSGERNEQKRPTAEPSEEEPEASTSSLREAGKSGKPKKKGLQAETAPGALGRETRSMNAWYRYGDSNPGPVAENHVS
jgi:hypothetical protein